MRLHLLGVRGSTPAPGADFVRYGGHTSCVVAVPDSPDEPPVVLDAGTGLRGLGALLGQPFRGVIVLSHLHWDHVHGLPFSAAVDDPGAVVEAWVPVPDRADDAEAMLGRMMTPPFFPIGPDGLRGSWTFRAACPGRLSGAFGAATVEVAPVDHKGGHAYAVRLEMDGTTVAYVPDHALTTTEPSEPPLGTDLVRGVDLLLHDGQFVAGEGEIAARYGHATVDAALAWADACEVGALVLTHHAPARTDEQLDALAARVTSTPQGRPVTFARQGDVLVPVPAADVVRTTP